MFAAEIGLNPASAKGLKSEGLFEVDSQPR
jgi:hypothetical protein